MPKPWPVSKARGGFTVSMRFRFPLGKVWAVATENDQLLHYFLDEIEGEFGPQLTPVRWYGENWGSLVLTPTLWEPMKRLEFTWQGAKRTYQTTVRYEFEQVADYTILRVTERGYTGSDLAKAFERCDGWAQMLCHMKVWLVLGVELRNDEKIERYNMPAKKVAKRKKNLPVGKGKLGFKVSNEYPVPAAKLWEAITMAKHTQKYFVDKVTGDFSPALTPVGWYWKRWGQHYHFPTVFQKEKKLEFRWEDHKGKYYTTITFTLRKKGKNTELEIHERGWKQSDLKNAFSNCEGWTTYLCYLKAYVTKGVILRTKS